MTVPDTPDYQRGVVAAQQLLGTISGGDSGTFTIPANAQGLIVHAPGGSVETLTSVVGATTGTYYPFTAIAIPEGSSAGSIYAVFVIPALDDTVTITVSDASDEWYVVADTGTGTGSVVAPTVPPGVFALSGAVAILSVDLPYPLPPANPLTLQEYSWQPAYDNEAPAVPAITVTAPLIAYAAGTGIRSDTNVSLNGLSTLGTSGVALQMALWFFDVEGENDALLSGEVDIAAGETGASLNVTQLTIGQLNGSDITFDAGAGSVVTEAGGQYTAVLYLFGHLI